VNKQEAREFVWDELRKVARPDSRFHLDFEEFIPDFEGSQQATEKLCEQAIYTQANLLFITPDNCLERLRTQALLDRKTQIVSTYGIRRGFVELSHEDVPPGQESFAVLLDVLEKLGHYISLSELRSRHPRVDLLVTGASAVNHSGIRFGKGHGFFDLEWAMLYEIGVVDVDTPVVAFVHDCQVVDVDLETSPFDTICDVIVTPMRVIPIEDSRKPEQGILWDSLEPNMIENIPPLGELKRLKYEVS
jgi:5-formyltetrahydrofolate cyclo-ligase